METKRKKGGSIAAFFAPAPAPATKRGRKETSVSDAATDHQSAVLDVAPTTVNTALALARRAHAEACAIADAAALTGRAPALRELLVSADWLAALATDLRRDSFRALESFLHQEWATAQVFPPPGCIFRALNSCALCDVRVVILGQDPYHDDAQACGLSFSVPKGQRVPSSLQNVYKELASDLSLTRPSHGDLERWAAQGVLLLNAVLTVRAHAANSHAKRGWEAFTDAVIRCVAQRSGTAPVVFLLWGKTAQEKAKGVLGGTRHVVLHAPHPSGLSAHRGFFGCKHFSAANTALQAAGKEPIDWQIV